MHKHIYLFILLFKVLSFNFFFIESTSVLKLNDRSFSSGAYSHLLLQRKGEGKLPAAVLCDVCCEDLSTVWLIFYVLVQENNQTACP